MEILWADNKNVRYILQSGEFAFVIDHRPGKSNLSINGDGAGVRVLIGYCEELKLEATDWYVFTKGNCEHWPENSIKATIGILEVIYDYQVFVTKEPSEKLGETVPLGLLSDEGQMRVQVDADTRIAFERKVIETEEYRELLSSLQAIFAIGKVSYTPETEDELSKCEMELRIQLDELRTKLRLYAPDKLKLELYEGLYYVNCPIRSIEISHRKEKELEQLRNRIDVKRQEMKEEEQRLLNNRMTFLKWYADLLGATGKTPKDGEIERMIERSYQRPSQSARPPLLDQTTNPVALQDANQQLLESQNKHSLNQVASIHQVLAQGLQRRLAAGETPIQAIQQLLSNMRIKGNSSKPEHLLEDGEKLRIFEDWLKSNSATLHEMLADDIVRVANKILVTFISHLEYENFSIESLESDVQ